MLEFIGLLDRDDFNVDSVDPANPAVHGQLVQLRRDRRLAERSGREGDLAVTAGRPGFDGHLLFPRLEQLIALSGLPVVYDDTATPQRLDVVLVEIVPTTSGAPGLALRLAAISRLAPIIDSARSQTRISKFRRCGNMPLDTELAIRTDGSVTFTPPSVSALDGTFGAKLILKRTRRRHSSIFRPGRRQPDGVRRLHARALTTPADGRRRGKWRSRLSAARSMTAKSSSTRRKGDGFLGKILPGTYIEADFSVVVGVSTERGFYFSGSSALEVRLPAHIELGPISIEALTLTAGLQDGKIPLSVGADIRAVLGPIEAVVQNMGVTATLSFPPGNAGNLGPAQLDIGFKPPSGVGLRV